MPKVEEQEAHCCCIVISNSLMKFVCNNKTWKILKDPNFATSDHGKQSLNICST